MSKLAKAEKTIDELRSLVLVFQAGLRDTLKMLDASRFGGQRTYRCLTPAEEKRLAEIEKLIPPHWRM